MGSTPNGDFSESTGLIPRFMKALFCTLPEDAKVEASFLEVYGEDIHDLLHPDRPSTTLREDADGTIVCSGLTSREVNSVEQSLQVLYEGTLNRTTAATLMNLTSSRSHAVFTVTLTRSSTRSKLTFVDLAGSERLKKTGASGERAKEGIDINKGLLALGGVINALSERLSHVPYRQSKLTRLLQEALGGNSQTLFLACVSPADTNASETLSTLHYANRARRIENAVAKNVDPESAEVRKWKCFADVLQRELMEVKFDTTSSKSDIEAYFIGLKAKAMENDDTSIELGQPFKQQPPLSMVTSKPLITSDAINHSVLQVDGFDPTLLDEVNPDEEMAILDQLLNIQQKDQEYDDEQKQDDLKLKEVEGELEEKEGLLLQLRESLKVYHNMKDQYESLMAEVQHLESEKFQLAQQLEKAQQDPSLGCSQAITRKLRKVEENLKRAREDTKVHRESYRKAQQQAKRCQAMERQITELKQGRTQLVKKQKEASVRHRNWTEQKTREILALQRKERSQSQKVSKLQHQIEIHKRNLGKRQEYCQKLLAQKQTAEKHLMQLIKTRQRKFKREPQKTPDIAAFDKKVRAVIAAAIRQKEYDDTVSNYGNAMRKLIEGVESEEEDSTLADLQVQVDIASSAMESSRSNLLEVPTLNSSALVQHVVDSLVDCELKRRQLSQNLELKKSVVMTLEMEVESLNSNVAVLQSEIVRSRVEDGTDMSCSEEVEQENLLLKVFCDDLNDDCRSLAKELAQAREKLTLTEQAASLADGGAQVPSQLLDELQSLWDKLGFPLVERELSRSKMENCLEEVCSQELTKIRQLLSSTTQAITQTQGEINMMVENLSIDTPEMDKPTVCLLPQLKQLQCIKNEVSALFEVAQETKQELILQVKSLVQGGTVEVLDPILHTLLDDSSTDVSSDFLKKCEQALHSVQAKRSKMLAKSGSSQADTHKLLKSMNYQEESKILSMVVHDLRRRNGALPSWWDPEVAKAVAKAVSSAAGVVQATERFAQHVACFYEAVSNISEGRQLLSQKLQVLVERAQTSLLKTVNDELGANEAYSSFHEALFQFPALSKERVHAFIAEINALASVVEDLSQSQVEALTVVWEALNMPPKDQSKFWGALDEAINGIQSKPGGPFDAIVELAVVEEWVLAAVKEATRSYRALEVRLLRLERIHEEVETLGTLQDAKSRIISLDSEVRLLSSKLNEFEDKKCLKQRLTTKKTTSSNLLKEERFRKQMQSKFTAKLGQLEAQLKSWKSTEGESFDHSLLSSPVRSHLKSGDRNEFMHLRTVEYKGAKRGAENVGPALPPAKRVNRTSSKGKPKPLSTAQQPAVLAPTPNRPKRSALQTKPSAKKRITLDPFGSVLDEAFSTRNKENPAMEE